MMPTTLAVQCLCWALLLPGHGPAQIFEWPQAAGQPLVIPHPHPGWGLPVPLRGIHGAPTGHPVPGHHHLPPATALSTVPGSSCAPQLGELHTQYPCAVPSPGLLQRC